MLIMLEEVPKQFLKNVDFTDPLTHFPQCGHPTKMTPGVMLKNIWEITKNPRVTPKMMHASLTLANIRANESTISHTLQ